MRRDLFGECNADGHPIDVFTRECCANCFQKECTRSLYGKTKFDQRALGWFDRYFSDKDQMGRDDPRFGTIAAKQFLMLDPGRTGRTPEISSWVDPRDLTEKESSLPEIKIDTQNNPEPAVLPAPNTSRSVPRHLVMANTNQSGKILTPNVSPTALPPRDPWSALVKEPSEQIVSPGAKIKMGSGS